MGGGLQCRAVEDRSECKCLTQDSICCHTVLVTVVLIIIISPTAICLFHQTMMRTLLHQLEMNLNQM